MPNGVQPSVTTVEEVHHLLGARDRERLDDLYSSYGFFTRKIEREARQLRRYEPHTPAHRALLDSSRRNFSLVELAQKQARDEFGVYFGPDGFVAHLDERD
jgi:hypothetical protein